MKNIIYKFIVVALFAGTSGFFGVSSALASSPEWNGQGPSGASPTTPGAVGDVPTLQVRNFTKDGPCSAPCNYYDTVTANPGDILTFQFYYHNTSKDSTALGSKVRAVLPTNSGKNFNVSGYLSASNGPTVSESVSIHVSGTENQTLSFMPGTVIWAADKPTVTKSLLGSESSLYSSSGLSIGTVKNWYACPVTGTGPYFQDTYCYRGYVTFRMQVSDNSGPTSENCVINNFTADDYNIDEGDSTNLNWNTTGCDDISISPSSYVGSYSSNDVDGSVDTDDLFSDKTFTLTATNNDGDSDTKNLTINVDQQNNDEECVINDFYAEDDDIDEGDNTTLHWSTTNCDHISISPSSKIDSYSTSDVDGEVDTDDLDDDETFTLHAYNDNSDDDKDLDINVNQDDVIIHHYECNDGDDNDGDGYEDLDDPGCSSSHDDDEYNYIAPQQNLQAVTTVATNITQNSANLNGVISSSNYNVNSYFEWGSTVALGNTTSSQNVGNGNAVATSAYISGLATNTIYYFRVVGTSNGVMSRGDIHIFRTLAPNAPQVIYVNNNTGGAVTSFVQLTIDSRFETVRRGDTIEYTVTYKNISRYASFTNAVVQILLPTNVEFVRSEEGIYNKADHTLTNELGTLDKLETGEFYFEGKVRESARDNELLVTTATLAYKNKGNALDTVIAYETNTVTPRDNSFLAGLAIFGADIFPHSLVGWLILILIVLLLVHYARKVFSNPAKPAPVFNHQYQPPVQPRPTAPTNYASSAPHDLPH